MDIEVWPKKHRSFFGERGLQGKDRYFFDVEIKEEEKEQKRW